MALPPTSWYTKKKKFFFWECDKPQPNNGSDARGYDMAVFFHTTLACKATTDHKHERQRG